MPTAYIALGSNIGDRRHYLELALDKLAKMPGVQLGKVSSVYQSQAVTLDGSGGPDFLNAVCQLHTTLSADELLQLLQGIEQALGRSRHARWAPRTIDLDILSYGAQVSVDRRLSLPHPELTQRDFVLRPLAEVAPQWTHPVTGQSVQSLLAALAESTQGGKVAACCGSF